MAFLGIKADRNALNHSDIIDGAALVKISQRNVTCCFINLNRFDGCGDLLDQCQMFFPVFLIGKIDDLF